MTSSPFPLDTVRLRFLPAVPGTNSVALTAAAAASAGLAADSAATAAAILDDAVQKSGSTMTGPLLMAADPLVPLEVATKAYVDAHTGGVGSGNISNSGAITPGDIAEWVDGSHIKSSSSSSLGLVKGPATNTDLFVPQWNGANSKTLKDGLAVGTAANNLVQLDGTARLPAVDGSQLLNVATISSGFLSGLRHVVDGTSHGIIIQPGAVADDTGTALIQLNAPITKLVNAAWVVGSGVGGRDTGPDANGAWYIWLIKRSDTGVVDALFSASRTAPTMPASYDKKRRIGSFMRIGGANTPFKQVGFQYIYSFIQTQDVDTATLTTARTTFFANAPTGTIVHGRAYMSNAAICNVWVGPIYEVDQAPAVNNSPGLTMRNAVAGGADTATLEVWGDDSFSRAMIAVRSSAAATTFRWWTTGYEDVP